MACVVGQAKINDVNGDYPDRTTGKREGTFTDAVFKIKTLPKGADGKPLFNMYSSDAFWLTQWNVNILWGLAWPELLDEFSASLVEYANNGGLLPRGPSGGGYSYIMTGNPAANLIVSTYMKGLLTKTKPIHAFETIKRNQMPGGMLGPKEDVAFYIKKVGGLVMPELVLKPPSRIGELHKWLPNSERKRTILTF